MTITSCGRDWAPLLVRRNPIQQWNEKEWWFAYAWDREHALYVSWAFVRAIYGDHFGILVAREGDGEPRSFQRSVLLDRVERDGRLCLENRARRWSLRFAEEDAGLRLRLTAPGWDVDLAVGPSPLPRFSRRENQFVRSYSVVHTYRNPVAGCVAVGGDAYALQTDHSYVDHCFGDVPARTGWHWLALQNRETALTSLVNYGPHAQRYTHVLHGGAWARLSPDVCFDAGEARAPWRVTSPDLELSVQPIGQRRTVTRMPPVLPFLTDLVHTELVVRGKGRIRTDGGWREHRDLVGVMEEHAGRW